MKLALCLLSCFLLLTGCATWEGLSPTTQAVLKAGAKLALSYGVQELGDRVKETRPFIGNLNTLIETTFGKPLDAEATGSALKAGVVKLVPAEHQATVLAQFKESLARSTAAATTDHRPQTADFNSRVAAKL